MSVSMLSEQLVAAGCKVAVFTTTANGPDELVVTKGEPQVVDGVPVTYYRRITKDHSHFSPSLLKAARKHAKEYNVMHVHAWWNTVSMLSCFIAIMRNVPVLLSPRGTLSTYSFQTKNVGFKWILHHLLGKYLLNRCHVHVTSAREQFTILQLFKPVSITVLPNFVKLPRQKQIERNLSGDFKLLFFFED